jgi:hypothetical protein
MVRETGCCGFRALIAEVAVVGLGVDHENDAGFGCVEAFMEGRALTFTGAVSQPASRGFVDLPIIRGAIRESIRGSEGHEVIITFGSRAIRSGQFLELLRLLYFHP